VTRNDLQQLVEHAPAHETVKLSSVTHARPTVAYPDESLRMIVYRMAETGLTRFPVIDRERSLLIGMVALSDLLKARARILDAEQRRERVFSTRIAMPFGGERRTGT
jgi:CBS-domain-containing membrane protein